MSVCLELILKLAHACRLFSKLIEQPSTFSSSPCTSVLALLEMC